MTEVCRVSKAADMTRSGYQIGRSPNGASGVVTIYTPLLAQLCQTGICARNAQRGECADMRQAHNALNGNVLVLHNEIIQAQISI